MKKLLLILLVLVGCFGQAQTLIPGYTDINQRYNWRAGFFRALNIPTGDSAQLQTGQTGRSGGIYIDTLHTITSPAGLYLYIEGVWVLQGTSATVNEPDALLYGGAVTYSGTGLVFNVQESIVRLCGNIYGFDSLQITLPAADPSFDKFYKIYLDSTGVRVLEGTPATPAQIPQIELCEWSLTDVLVRAAEVTPAITQVIIYDENTESVVTNSNTTTDPNNTTNVFRGAKSVNVTNINNTDQVFFTTNGITPVTWNLRNKDALSGHIKLKAVMPTQGRVTAQFMVGTSPASAEVVIPINKNSLLYQPFSVPIASFAPINNYDVPRVRFRYLRPGNSTNYTGFYLDYVFLDSGMVINQPGAVSIGLTIAGNAFNVAGSRADAGGTFSITPNGNSTQYINGANNLITFPALLSEMGTIDGRSKSADGATIDGTELFMQLADDTYPGLLSPAHFIRLEELENDSITNGTGGDTLLVYVNDSLLKIKSLIAGTNMAFVVTGDNITLNATGGGTRFGFSGEDDVAGENRNFDADVFDFSLESNGGNINLNTLSGSFSNSIKLQNDAVLRFESDNSGLVSFIEMNGGAIAFHSDAFYFVENMADYSANPAIKVMVWDSTSNAWGTVPTASLGGGGGSGSNLSYDAANHEVDIDGGGTSATIPLSLADGATEGLASFTAADFDLTAGNVAIDYTNGQAASGSTKGFLTSADWTTFNGKAPLASPTFTGTVTIPTPFTLGAVSVLPTGTELNFVDGVTSAIQTQIDGKQSTLTNSAGLIAALSDESGSGLVLFNTTTNPAINTITPSGTGISPSTMKAVVDADFSLTDATGVQTAFPSGIDVWTLQGSTTYHVKGQYNILGGTASKTIGIAFLLGGGASVHSLGLIAQASNALANTLAAAHALTYMNQVSVTVLTVAATTAGNQVRFEGYIKMNAGGTITPQISFGTNAPAGAVAMKLNSFIEFTPVGTHTFTSIGSVN